MWILRYRTGPQKGQTIKLTEGSYTVGRSPQCDILINSSKVSKQHAILEVRNNKVYLADQRSTNGTFVNGVKIKDQRINSGDKIAFDTAIVDIVYGQEHALVPGPGFASGTPQMHPISQPYSMDPSQTHSPNDFHGADEIGAQSTPASGLAGIIERFQDYMDDVVLPGVYKLPETFQFRWVLGWFVVAFIVFVTAFSTVPLMQILKDSINLESQQRATTIARTLATLNQSSIAQGILADVSITFAAQEQGDIDSYIIDAISGDIIAPNKKSGEYLDIEFVHSARKAQDRQAVKQVDDETVVALEAIFVRDPTTAQLIPKAYAVVKYKMGNVALGDERTMSLFIQTLFIALIVGLLLFYFLYQVIDYPIRDLNDQLDTALKKGTSNLVTDYHYESLQTLVSNINSSLSRMGNADEGLGSGFDSGFAVDRSSEVEQLVHLIGFPAMAVMHETRLICAINPAMESQLNINSMDLLQQNLDAIIDQAFRESVRFLIGECQNQPHSLHLNQLEFSGEPFEITAKAIMGEKDIAYYVIVILPQAEVGI